MIANNQDRLWTKDFVLLMLVQMLDMFTYNTVAPVIAKYSLELGASLAVSGVALSAFFIASLVARPASGFVSDRLGRKKLVLFAVAISAAMQLGYAFIPNLAAMFAFRVIHGLCYSLFGTAISAMALDSLPESRQSEGMGWFGSSYVFASVIGPVLGVYLSDAFGFEVMFLVTAIVSALSFLMMTLVKEPHAVDGMSGEGRSNKAPFLAETDNKHANKIKLTDFVSVKSIPLAAMAACFLAVWSMISGYIVLVGESRGVDGIAFFFVVNSLVLFFSRPMVGKLSDKYGLQRLMYPAIAFETVALLGISLAQQLWLFLLSAGIKALGSGGVLPSIQAQCGKMEPEDRAGVAMSTYLLGNDIGYAVGPLIGGLLLQYLGYEYIFFGAFPIIALNLLIFVLWERHIQKRES